jgi:hypothetical protein
MKTCIGYWDEKDCSVCDGTGEDVDMTGSGMCGYCTGGTVNYFNNEGCEHCEELGADRCNEDVPMRPMGKHTGA